MNSVGTSATAHLSSAILAYSGSFSIPMNDLSVGSAATPVVPDPQNGSSIVHFSGQYILINHSINATGLTVG